MSESATPSPREIIARAWHKRLGYDAWPYPECTQCMDAADSILTALEAAGMEIVAREPSADFVEREFARRYPTAIGVDVEKAKQTIRDDYRAVITAHEKEGR